MHKTNNAHEEPDLCVAERRCSTQRRLQLTQGEHEDHKIKPTSCSLWDVSQAKGSSALPPDSECSVAICGLKGWTPYFHGNCVDAGSPWQQALGPGLGSYQQLSIMVWAATSPKANVLGEMGINPLPCDRQGQGQGEYNCRDKDGARWTQGCTQFICNVYMVYNR